mgnify:CR=1 FL=1
MVRDTDTDGCNASSKATTTITESSHYDNDKHNITIHPDFDNSTSCRNSTRSNSSSSRMRTRSSSSDEDGNTSELTFHRTRTFSSVTLTLSALHIRPLLVLLLCLVSALQGATWALFALVPVQTQQLFGFATENSVMIQTWCINCNNIGQAVATPFATVRCLLLLLLLSVTFSNQSCCVVLELVRFDNNDVRSLSDLIVIVIIRWCVAFLRLNFLHSGYSSARMASATSCSAPAFSSSPNSCSGPLHVASTAARTTPINATRMTVVLLQPPIARWLSCQSCHRGQVRPSPHTPV